MIDLLKRCKDSLWVRTHIDARIPDVSAAHLIEPAWLDHHRAAQRPAVPRNHYINTTRRISYDLSGSRGRVKPRTGVPIWSKTLTAGCIATSSCGGTWGRTT